jgi:pimeloyl-ACP methyl ester carboxylesterase
MRYVHASIFPALIACALLGLLASGCEGLTPGQLDAVAPISDRPRQGNVYLVRGWIGIFSTGMDTLGQEANDAGVHAEVYQGYQWPALAHQITEKYRDAGANREPLVLVGHSYGADDVLRVARELNDANIPVDLLVTFDPVTPPDVPANVRKTVNFYRPNGVFDLLPFLRGIPLELADDAHGTLENVNIRTDPRHLMEPFTDHFNIEKRAPIQKAVLEEIFAVCRERGEPSLPAMTYGTSGIDTSEARTASLVVSPTIYSATRPAPTPGAAH